MKNFKINFCMIGACTAFYVSPQIFSKEIGDNSGQLHGKILAPSGADLSSVMVQVIGANQRDNFIYYTVPNKDGEFNFDGILPSGSVVQLYIWDGNGVLNSTTLNAYVNHAETKEIGVYEVMMQEVQYTQSIAHVYNTTHNLTSAGVCGAVETRQKNGSGMRIFAYDRYAKYNGPLFEQVPDAKNQFCFFNLNSTSGTDMYDFVVAGSESERKTFTLYLPPGTFVDNAFFDGKASLYRPITPYFLNEDPLSQNKTQWKKISAVNLATSEDYSFVSYDDKRTDENLVYFPLSNELLEISYFLTGENSNHFFFLLPRTELFADIQFSSLSNGDRVYVDYANSFPFKLVTEEEFIQLNSNYYFQTWNERFGSLFVNLDLSKFGVQNTNEVKLSVRNSAGQEIGTFDELVTARNQNLMGYFFNLFPGRYQIFLTNVKNELLWTYEVRSYANRVQVLTNNWDDLQKETRLVVTRPPQTQQEDTKTKILPELNSIAGNSEEITDVLYDRTALQKEKILMQNNFLYQHDAGAFCEKKQPPSFLNALQML